MLIRRLLLALSVTLGLTACRLDSLGPEGRVAGRYDLETINGDVLPYTFSRGARLISDQVTLNSDGSYTETVQYSNAPTYIERGVFRANNGDIQFEPDDRNIPLYGGSVSGSILTTFSESYRSVYRRR